jgi:hypothetical protein
MEGRTILLLGALGIAVFVGRNAIHRQWVEVFPDDPIRATALARCAADDRQFNAFSAESRAACYQRWLDVSASGPSRLRIPNQVDLARAAGESVTGQMPEGDIRNEQATEHYQQTRHYDTRIPVGPPFDPHRFEHRQEFSASASTQ